MTVYISLLRGINVSGQKKIKMVDLKALYESLGFANVKTYIQSGNVLFQSASTDTDAFGTAIKAGIERQYGYTVSVMLYTVDDWRAIQTRNPFTGAGDRDPKLLHVTLLAAQPDPALTEALPASGDNDEHYQIDGQTVYMYLPNGYGRTKLDNNFWERRLKVAATTRNWNTVNKLLELAAAVE